MSPEERLSKLEESWQWVRGWDQMEPHGRQLIRSDITAAFRAAENDTLYRAAEALASDDMPRWGARQIILSLKHPDT